MGKPLSLIGILIIAVIIFSTYRGNVQDRSMPQTQTGPDIRSTSLDFQSLTDKVAQAALNNDWGVCRYFTDRLQMAWDSAKPSSSHRLDSILEVDRALAELHALVLRQDQAAVINSAAHLTRLFAGLAAE